MMALRGWRCLAPGLAAPATGLQLANAIALAPKRPWRPDPCLDVQTPAYRCFDIILPLPGVGALLLALAARVVRMRPGNGPLAQWQSSGVTSAHVGRRHGPRMLGLARVPAAHLFGYSVLSWPLLLETPER